MPDDPSIKVGTILICSADVTVKQLVDLGVRLKREIDQKERELRKVKSLLREQAEKVRLVPEKNDFSEEDTKNDGAEEEPYGLKTIEFDGSIGVAQVTFSNPTRDLDQSRARDIISLFGDIFDNYFVLKVDYRDRDILDSFLKDNPNIKEKFNELTTKRETKPRVVITRV